jgi:hypothetical protein
MSDLNLIEKGDDWVLYRAEVVQREQQEMITQLGRSYRLFKNTFTGCDSSLKSDNFTLSALPTLFSDTSAEDKGTIKEMAEADMSGYRFYNVFNLTSPSPLYWFLFKNIKQVVRDTLGNNQPLWMQCWMNFHKQNEVLKWHDHHFPYHGYVSIDPKNSTTEFKQGSLKYNIENVVGNIYFGPGWERMHRVVVNEDYDDSPRITLGFDILTEPTLPDDQFSLIPLL